MYPKHGLYNKWRTYHVLMEPLLSKTIPKPYRNHTKTIPKPYQNFYFLEIPKIPFRRIGFRILTMFQNHCERDRHCSDGPHLIMSRIIVEMVGECFNSEGLLTGEERTLDCAILATLLMALQSVHLGFMLTPGLLENQINWVKKSIYNKSHISSTSVPNKKTTA